MLYRILKLTIPPLVKLLWIKKVNGLENIPKNKAFIVASNHASYMDHFIIRSILDVYTNRKVHFLAKKEHFETPFQRFWHKTVEAIPIDRSKGEAALKKAFEYLKKGKIIGIYPEGTRTLNGELQRGKTGVARLALWARVPVVPVGLIGTFNILSKGKTIPKLKKAKMNIGEAMYFNRYYKNRITKTLLRNITTQIMREIARLAHQSYKQN